jgi:small subunit ribosomal protein S18
VRAQSNSKSELLLAIVAVAMASFSGTPEVIEPGNSKGSLLVLAVSQLDEEKAMPPKFKPGRRGPGGPGGRKFFRRKKVCKFCVEKIDGVNYKDVRLLQQFVAESGKIVPRRLTGVCTRHQRRVSAAIKQARNIALLPFSNR